MNRPRLPARPDTEQRRLPRHGLEVNVDVTSGNQFFVGVTRDISGGGLFVAAEKLPAIGERIALRFNLPGTSHTIAVTGEVRWQRTRTSDTDPPSGFGVQFLDLRASDAEALQRHIAAHDALFHPDR